jgi:hypothetical protein
MPEDFFVFPQTVSQFYHLLDGVPQAPEPERKKFVQTQETTTTSNLPKVQLLHLTNLYIGREQMYLEITNIVHESD